MDKTNYRCRLQAHRGVASECPENTMVSFEEAIKQGYDTIELDPGYTKDGIFVVLHDAGLNRVARNADGSELNEKILISDITYEEALKYDVGISFDEKFKGTKIPLLEDVLKLGKENNIRIKIDNKIEWAFPNEVTERMYPLFEKYEKWIGLTSGKSERIDFYAERFPDAELHYDGAFDEKTVRELSEKHGDRLTVWVPQESPLTSWVTIPFIDEEIAETVKKHSKLGVWIVNDYKEFDDVIGRFKPYIVETTGVIKPQK